MQGVALPGPDSFLSSFRLLHLVRYLIVAGFFSRISFFLGEETSVLSVRRNISMALFFILTPLSIFLLIGKTGFLSCPCVCPFFSALDIKT